MLHHFTSFYKLLQVVYLPLRCFQTPKEVGHESWRKGSELPIFPDAHDYHDCTQWKCTSSINVAESYEMRNKVTLNSQSSYEFLVEFHGFPRQIPGQANEAPAEAEAEEAPDGSRLVMNLRRNWTWLPFLPSARIVARGPLTFPLIFSHMILIATWALWMMWMSAGLLGCAFGWGADEVTQSGCRWLPIFFRQKIIRWTQNPAWWPQSYGCRIPVLLCSILQQSRKDLYDMCGAWYTGTYTKSSGHEFGQNHVPRVHIIFLDNFLQDLQDIMIKKSWETMRICHRLHLGAMCTRGHKHLPGCWTSSIRKCLGCSVDHKTPIG